MARRILSIWIGSGLAALAVAAFGCSSDKGSGGTPGSDDAGTGGAASLGGASATGGATALGGASATGGATANGGAGNGGTSTAPNPNDWDIVVTTPSGDTHSFELPKLTNSLLDVSYPTANKTSVIYANAPYSVTIQFNFAKAFDQIVPLTVNELSTNYTYAVITYNDLLGSKSWLCNGAYALGGAAQQVTGKFALTIDSAEAQPGKTATNATEYLIHGSLHATCPGRTTADTGDAKIDVTF